MINATAVESGMPAVIDNPFATTCQQPFERLFEQRVKDEANPTQSVCMAFEKNKKIRRNVKSPQDHHVLMQCL
jgi:hypothetical protein